MRFKKHFPCSKTMPGDEIETIKYALALKITIELNCKHGILHRNCKWVSFDANIKTLRARHAQLKVWLFKTGARWGVTAWLMLLRLWLLVRKASLRVAVKDCDLLHCSSVKINGKINVYMLCEWPLLNVRLCKIFSHRRRGKALDSADKWLCFSGKCAPLNFGL